MDLDIRAYAIILMALSVLITSVQVFLLQKQVRDILELIKTQKENGAYSLWETTTTYTYPTEEEVEKDVETAKTEVLGKKEPPSEQ